MALSTKSSERLTAMQTLLREGGWTRGAMHNYEGRCLLGALLTVHDRYASPLAWQDPLVKDDLRWLHEAATLLDKCGCRGCVTGHAYAERLMAWNDSPHRTFAEVMAVFDRAIVGARGAETVSEAPVVAIAPYVPLPPYTESYVVRYQTWAPLQVAKVVVEEKEERELVSV